MKIVIATGIYPPDIGGPASFSRALAREFTRLGQVVTVVCYGNEKTLSREGWPVEIVNRSGSVLSKYLRYAWRVYKVAVKSDVVFLQGPVSEGLPGTIGAWLAGKPTIMKVVGDYAWEIYKQTPGSKEMLDEFVKHGHGGGLGLRERAERWSSAHARHVIVPSRYLKQIVTAWGVDSKKISVIYNTIPPLPRTESRENLRRRFIIEHKKVLTYIGRAVPWKHLDFIIGLLPELPKDCVLVIGGDGPSLVEWKKTAERCGVLDRVKFLGRISREQAAEWFQASDMFLLPSSYEGFPHVIAEAASVGLPSLVSDRGGNPETKELFPEQVTVLPHLNSEAWSKAFLNLPGRLTGVHSAPFEKTAEAYLDIMKKYARLDA